jgi:hypothetical protein
MRGILGSSVASLAVLYVLFVLLSGHRDIPNGSGLINNSGRISTSGDNLIRAIVLRRQRQLKDYPISPNADRPIKVQQALKDDGFYPGLDGTMRQSTREAVGSFQESNHLNVTGIIDDDTGRELGASVEYTKAKEKHPRQNRIHPGKPEIIHIKADGQ